MIKKVSAFILLATILLLQSAMLQAQYILKQAQEFAAVNNYVKAKPLFEKAYEKRKTIDAARSLAEIFTQTRDYVFAESWYAKVVAMPNHTADDELHYAEVLMNNNKYAEAAEQLQKYLSQKNDDERAGNMLQGCSMAKEWLSKPVKGTLENMKALNSSYSDWGLAILGDKYVFASDRPNGQELSRQSFFSNNNVKRELYTMTGNNYLHLFEGNGKDTSAIQPLSKKINGDYHSASPSYTSGGKEMYYAATDYIKKKVSFLGKEKPYTIYVGIVKNTWDSAAKSWGEPTGLPFNDLFNYSIGDPFISADGRTLLFVSSDPKTSIGGTDIYYTTKDDEGKWKEPKNLGREINTKGNERTPFMDAKGNLYFASDGRPGMGGLDIFKAVPAQNKGGWIVTNMGSPVNSAQDDFAPYFSADDDLYFSSNRTGGKGSDDIYHFKSTEVPVFTTEGIVRDKTTNEPLADVVVTLYNKTTGTPQKAITGVDGKYHFALDNVSDYEISAEKTGYATTSIPLSTKGLGSSKTFPKDIFLEKIQLNEPVKMENIYFDFDKWAIRSDATGDLDKLVKMLQDNPTFKVEMSSHTDSRGKAAYNLKLSQKRADATVKYLVDRGIAKDRLTAKGYGSARLVNGCAKGVKCTEAEHQQNRRTEFTIIEK